MTALRRYILTIAAAAATAAPFGCASGGTIGARQLIEPITEPGRGMLRMTGGADWLIKQGRIDAHRRIEASDGAEMDVWVIKARPAKDAVKIGATALVLHGMATSKAWFLSLGEALAKAGWDVILPDLRAHGYSGGRYVTWGAMEKYDMKEVVSALVEEGLVAPRIFALGGSLGGCVAIQYAAIDPRCEGAMALAPPTDIRGGVRLMGPFSTEAAVESAVARAGTIAGFDPDNASAVAAARKLKCPLILVHGAWDVVVPREHCRKIYDAAQVPKKLILLWFADHTSVQVGRDKWIVKKMQVLLDMALQHKPAPRTP